MQTNDLLAAARAEAAEFKRLREPAIAGNWTARAEDESKKLWTVRESLTLYDGEFCFHDKPTAKFIAHAANHAQEIAATTNLARPSGTSKSCANGSPE